MKLTEQFLEEHGFLSGASTIETDPDFSMELLDTV